MKKPITGWQGILKDRDGFEAFVAILRDKGIKSIEIGGLKLELHAQRLVPVTEPKIDPLPQLSEEERKKEEEELLYYSA